ncbi:hypothetical protein [Desulfurobacterium sp.]
MKKLLFVPLCVAIFVFSFFYFFPADVVFLNVARDNGVKVSSLEGNGLYLKLKGFSLKGVSFDREIDVLNRLAFLDIVSGESRVRVRFFPLKVYFSVKKLPVSVSVDGFEGDGRIDAKGFLDAYFSGNATGRVHFRKVVYKGIDAGRAEVVFSFRNGRFSADISSSPVRGKVTGKVVREKDAVSISGVARIFAGGGSFSEKFKYDLKGFGL